MREEISEKSIKELVRNAQNGEQSAFAELKVRYSPLIDGCSHRFATNDMADQDIEDLYQEAFVSFCSAVCSYNCDNENVEFGLYAKICIENRLVSFIRSHNRRNRLHALSLDALTEGVSDAEPNDFLQSLVDRERTVALIRTINSCLSKYENRIWQMYVSGMTVSQISKVLSVDSKSVSNAIYRIRKKLKETLQKSR